MNTCKECIHAEMCKWIDELEGRGCDFYDDKPCELLILKSDILLHQDDRKKWAESIKREKENGVIILPPYFEPLLVPNDIEINIEQEPCDDAISRDAVIEATHHCGDLQEVREVVQQLPSVNPQPREDAISREDALKVASKECQEFRGIYGRIEDGIQKLPPVTPRRHKAHWLRVTTVNPKEFCNRCSECGYEQFYAERYNFCPNCGVEMSKRRSEMIDKDKFLREMAIERNDYVNDCNKRIAEEDGKIKGADYILNRIVEFWREQNCGAKMVEPKESEDKG